MKMFISIFAIFTILLSSFHVYGQENLTAPIIFPKKQEYTINATKSFTLRCWGKTQVTWTTPNNTMLVSAEENLNKYSSIEINSYTIHSSKYPFKSDLTINNASYLDVGFYYCHESTTVTNDLSKGSNIYIYVYDLERLSVLSEGLVIPVTKYSDVVLPCRPTSPDVYQELRNADGEVKPGSTGSKNGEIVTFDARIGYTISQVMIDGTTIYNCIFQRGKLPPFDILVILDEEKIDYSASEPYIEVSPGDQLGIGKNLSLKCLFKYKGVFNMQWITPDQNILNENHISISEILNSEKGFYKNLEIKNTTIQDQGNYTCIVNYHNHSTQVTKFIKIYGQSEHFLNLTEEIGLYNISVNASEPFVQWIINIKANPKPKLEWFKNENNQTKLLHNNTSKYEIHTDETYSVVLIIRNITVKDTGHYTLTAMNNFHTKNVELFLNVTDKPSANIEIRKFYKIHQSNIIQCKVLANPEASIEWFFKPCLDENCNYTKLFSDGNNTTGFLQTSYLNITAIHTGYITCNATNSLGVSHDSKGFLVTDVDNGFNIWSSDENIVETENKTTLNEVAVGDYLTIYCAASKYNYTSALKWYKKSGVNTVLLENNDHYDIEYSSTEYSNKTSLTIQALKKYDSSEYFCEVENKTDFHKVNVSIVIAVKDLEKPVIINSTMNGSDGFINAPYKLVLRCIARGFPKPIVTWYKDGTEIKKLANSKIEFTQSRQVLTFQKTDFDDEGTYSCNVSNKVGFDKREMRLILKNKPRFNYIYIIIIVVMTILFGIVLILILLKFKKERALRRELKMAGLANFAEGALESINPELGINEQADLLPYDRKYEFPRDKLKLGKQLGSGAFGVVMKADAYGLIENEEKTTVAVKMVKKHADFTYIKALASELKIMVHLGQHLNVLNLLGACTNNVIKHEFLVIVEYCKFGNLHNYLLRHRNNFIDQIDSSTGKIDYNFGSNALDRSFSISSNDSSKNDLVPINTENDQNFLNHAGISPLTKSEVISMAPSGEDEMVNSSVNIKDSKGKGKPILTKDLISWSFQVARGMEYLASRKILHGDLAARNILLCENNVVKICDFGLSRSMYKTDNYKKQGDELLPVKWMAIESIRDCIFSTQSDVWSYGIVLWEFFSLAQTPYPGMVANENLYNKLESGYKMDCPLHAPTEIYRIMCNCWNVEPLLRPTFTKLAGAIGLMLEYSVRQHYIDLNNPYLIMNTQRLCEGQNDYLAMLSPPDFGKLSSPHYVNNKVLPSAIESDGYLSMKPNAVVDPQIAADNTFNLSSNDASRSNSLKNNNETSGLDMELIPIHCEKDLDCKNISSNLNHSSPPTTPKSYLNPSYQIYNKTNNYVDMAQNKNSAKLEHNVN